MLDIFIPWILDEENVLFRIIVPSKQENILELLSIDYLKNKDDYEITLIFNNNAQIVLSSDTLECRLEDQSEIK